MQLNPNNIKSSISKNSDATTIRNHPNTKLKHFEESYSKINPDLLFLSSDEEAEFELIDFDMNQDNNESILEETTQQEQNIDNMDVDTPDTTKKDELVTNNTTKTRNTKEDNLSEKITNTGTSEATTEDKEEKEKETMIHTERHKLIASLWIKYNGKNDKDKNSVLHNLQQARHSVETNNRNITMIDHGK